MIPDFPRLLELKRFGFSTEQAVSQILLEANELVSRSCFSEALSLLSPLIQPDSPTDWVVSCLVTAGRAALLKGDLKLSLFFLLRAWVLEPSSVSVNVNLGDAFLEIKAFEQARTCYLVGREHSPRDFIHEEKLGILEYELGNFKEATRHLDRAISLCDDDDNPNHAKFVLALCQVELGLFSNALPFLAHATALDPNSAEAWLGRAKCEEALGIQTARDCFRKYGELIP